MTTLSLDIGSSSVKAQLFRAGAPIGSPVRVTYPTKHDGPRVEIEPDTLLAAVAKAIAAVPRARSAEVIGLSVMSPAWVAIDRKGRTVTPIVTHQDRRSIEQAKQLEHRVGAARYLRLAGNRPFPGGISATTCAWFFRNQKSVMARADLVGHLNTFMHRRLTGARVIDTSNASFTGLYLTCTQAGWSDELCAAVGISPSLLPRVVESDVAAGKITPEAARAMGLTAGTPMMAGMVDTSAALLLTGVRPGQLFHVCGSTDVLAVVCAKARPHPKLLTRALGIGRRWTAAATIAAAGSSLDWMHSQFFRDLPDRHFHALLAQRGRTSVHFEPYLAGERTSIEQKQAAFSHLTLATTRQDMLTAVIESLAADSAGRLKLLAHAHARFLPTVFVSGGGGALADLSHRDWPRDSRRRFRHVDEASLRGLATLMPRH